MLEVARALSCCRVALARWHVARAGIETSVWRVGMLARVGMGGRWHVGVCWGL